MTIEQIITFGEVRIYNNSAYREELKRIYFEVFKEHLAVTCMNCVSDAIFRLKYYLNNNNKHKMETTKIVPCDFKLKDNQVIYIRARHMHITNDNLTNELALLLLRISVKNITNFVKYPENWKDMLDGSKTNPSEPDPKIDEQFKADVKKEDVPLDPPAVVPVATETTDQIAMKYTKDQIIGLLGDYPHKSTDPKYVLAALLVNKRKEVKDEDHNNKTE